MLSNHRVSIVLLLAASLVVITASVSAQELTLLVHWGPGGAEYELLSQYCKEYEQMNPGVSINLIGVAEGGGPEMVEKFVVMTAAGTPPSAIHVAVGNALSRANDTTIIPNLLPLPGPVADKLDDFYLPQVLERAMLDGTYIGLPTEFNIPGVVYNKLMFEQAGLALQPETPIDYEDYFALVRKLTVRSEGRTERYSLNISPTRIPHEMESYLLSHGFDLVSPDGRGQLNTAEVLKAAELYGSIFTEGYGFYGWFGASAAIGGLGSAMAQCPNYLKFVLINNQRQLYEEGAFVSGPLPYGSLGKPVVRSAEGGWMWAAVNTGDDRQIRETFRLLEWLNLEQTAEGTTRMGNVLATLGSMPATYVDMNNQPTLQEPFMQGYLAALSHYEFKPWPPVPGAQDALSALRGAMNAIIRNGVAPHQALEEAQVTLENALREAAEQ